MITGSRQNIKVFLLLFLQKKKNLLFLKKKKQKDFYFLPLLTVIALLAGAARAETVQAPQISPPDTWVKKTQGTIRVLNKLDSTVQTVILHVGETTQYQSLSITLAGCAVRPADLPPDSAAHLKVTDSREDQPGFDAWILQKEPAINLYEHPVYDIQLVSCS